MSECLIPRFQHRLTQKAHSKSYPLDVPVVFPESLLVSLRQELGASSLSGISFPIYPTYRTERESDKSNGSKKQYIFEKRDDDP